MRLFKSKRPNLVHYVTGVTYARVPIFRNEHACSLFIQALATTRLKEPFKLIGYVLMPDHFHLLANPLCLDISVVVGRLKGRTASLILAWLRDKRHAVSLARLKLARPLKTGQTHAVWQQDFSDIDVWSRKFIRQKLIYIHNNPVRAGLVDHPGKWHWSSYRAYFPHKPEDVPIEIDQRWLLDGRGIGGRRNCDEMTKCRGRTSPASKRIDP